MVYFGIQMYSDFVLDFFITCTVIWVLIQVVKLWPRGNWIKFAVQIALLIVIYPIIEVGYRHQAQEYRKVADMILEKIIAYKANHGLFPYHLKDIGEQENAALYRVKYSCIIQDRPLLYYRDSDTLNSDYIYDFEKKSWIDTSNY